MIVGIDSMVLIYAGIVPRKGAATPKVKELIRRAKLLLRILHRRKAQIVLPMVAVGEVLVPVPKENKSTLIAELSRHFNCRVYDAQAAAIASELHAMYKAQSPSEMKYEDRAVLKADVMIVASAKAAGATNFYTNDDNCRALANLIMRGFPLPTNDMEDLFAETET